MFLQCIYIYILHKFSLCLQCFLSVFSVFFDVCMMFFISFHFVDVFLMFFLLFLMNKYDYLQVSSSVLNLDIILHELS